MNLSLEDCATTAQAVTKICYNESTRCLNYKMAADNLEDLKKCVEIIHGYNEFDYKIVNEALDDFANIKRYYNPDNPNNGNDLLDFEIGREGSPVMYIRYFNYGEVKCLAEDGTNRPFTVGDFEEAMRKLSRAAKADEFDIENDGMSFVCRLWWD